MYLLHVLTLSKALTPPYHLFRSGCFFYRPLLAQARPSPSGGGVLLLATVAVRLAERPHTTRGGVLLAFFRLMGKYGGGKDPVEGQGMDKRKSQAHFLCPSSLPLSCDIFVRSRYLLFIARQKEGMRAWVLRKAATSLLFCRPL